MVSISMRKVWKKLNFIYKKSKVNLMVLDILRTGNALCDFGAVTEDMTDMDLEFLFCVGNLATMPFKHFLVPVNAIFTARL